MTTSAQAKPVWDGFILPDDLSVYIGKKTLVKLILDAIEGLNARTAAPEAVATGNSNFQPAMMLTLLTYCYATGSKSALRPSCGAFGNCVFVMRTPTLW